MTQIISLSPPPSSFRTNPHMASASGCSASVSLRTLVRLVIGSAVRFAVSQVGLEIVRMSTEPTVRLSEDLIEHDGYASSCHLS
jgi:hypothetical protein